MTRCRKHQADVSSNIGVCASCLRERLIPLLAIQSPPLIFPRSVSPPPPRVHHHPPPPPLFFTTPQLHKPTNTNSNSNSNSSYNKSTKFSLLPKFLRSNSSSSSSTWISTFFSSKKSTSTSTSEAAEIPCRRRGRGMSPARVSDCGGDDEYDDGGGESARGTPARRNRRNVTTAFCLSPLVRPSPKRRWDQKPTTEAGMMMMMPPQSLGAAAGFCANRSRKMADFGRLQRRP